MQQFMNRVLLVQDDQAHEIIKENAPYAVLLIGNQVLNKSVIVPVNKERLEKLSENGNETIFDKEPFTLHTYKQACIEYWTKEDFEANKGIYSEYLNELIEEAPYEYTAKIV